MSLYTCPQCGLEQDPQSPPHLIIDCLDALKAEVSRLREAIEPAKKIAEYVRAYNDGVQQDYYGCVDALKSFEAVLESKPWI